MKIAIYDPFPYIGGPSTFSWHVRYGLMALNHQASVVTSTASGRALKRWDNVRIREPLVVRHDELVEYLNGYDAVFLNELRCTTHENVVKRVGGIPLFAKVMRRVKVPWTSYLHGPMDMRYPRLPALLDSPGFCGTIFSLHQDLYTTPLLQDVEGMVLSLPFSSRGWMPPNIWSRRVGMLGMMTVRKGMGRVAEALEGDTSVMFEMWGTHLFTYAKILSERLASRGWQVKRDDETYGATWTASIGKVIAMYRGPFDDYLKTASRFGVAASITDESYARWVEFATLQYVDAGCLLVGMPHLFGASGFSYYNAGTGLREALMNALRDVGTDRHKLMVVANRKVLHDEHDPRKFARAIVEVLA